MVEVSEFELLWHTRVKDSSMEPYVTLQTRESNRNLICDLFGTPVGTANIFPRLSSEVRRRLSDAA